MQVILGNPAQGFERNEFEKVGYLLVAPNGEPLMSVYDTRKAVSPFIFSFGETDGDKIRWLITPIDPEYIEAFLNREIGTSELIISSNVRKWGKEFYIAETPIG